MVRQVQLDSIFSRVSKWPPVRFHTSSVEKFLQARKVFQMRGVPLEYFRESQDPYREDYHLGQSILLQQALDEIRHRVGARSLFFVEDTSVKVSALSSQGQCVPGLRVKEWFSGITFERLDRTLRARGNDRRATVYSDIGLYIPKLQRTVFFHGETTGIIVDFAPDPHVFYQHPWLTTSTFNGWFVPAGADKPLGSMQFEESYEYDFRVKSLTALLDRIEEYVAVIQVRQRSFSFAKPDRFRQQWLFARELPLVLVIGRVCAGKTTLGQHLADRHYRLHIEASDELKSLADQADFSDSLSAYERARCVLRQKGSDSVARAICRRYQGKLGDGAVITGFRTIEEIIYCRTQFPSSVVIFVDAGDRIRFERHLERGRLEEITTFDSFQAYDRDQRQFGLWSRARDVVDVARDVADCRLHNVRGLADYHAQIDLLMERLVRPREFGQPDDLHGTSVLRAEALRDRRVFRCLRALDTYEGPMTCSQIRGEMLAMSNGPVISERHLNWILAKLPGLADRIVDGSRIQYGIRPAGRAYIKAVNMKR